MIRFALFAALALILSPALRADDEVHERARRIQAEIERLAIQEKEAAAAVEKEAAAIRAEVVRLRAEREKIEATPQEKRGDHVARIEALARQEAMLREKSAALEARHAAIRQDLAARRERLADEVEVLRRTRTTAKGEAKRISGRFEATPLGEVLDRLAGEGGLSFVLVEGRLGEETVTANFQDVPAIEAALAVLETAGYLHDRTPAGVVLVRGKDPRRELEALQLRVEILELEARRRELERALSGEPK